MKTKHDDGASDSLMINDRCGVMTETASKFWRGGYYTLVSSHHRLSQMFWFWKYDSLVCIRGMTKIKSSVLRYRMKTKQMDRVDEFDVGVEIKQTL